MSKTNSTPENSSIDLAIGSAVRDLRENLNLTARQLSVQLNVSAAMISRIENAQASPSIATLSALSKALNVPVVSLFGPTHSADGFWNHPGQAVELDMACRPCSLHGGRHCPIGDHACMEDIGVDQVWKAIAQVRSDHPTRVGL